MTFTVPEDTSMQATRTAMQSLLEFGQSVWLDDLQRGMIGSGKLAALVRGGLRGMTSNPSTFERAITSGTEYDAALGQLLRSHKTDKEVLETLMIEDVQAAAHIFGPLYRRTRGRDGFVSIEVSPELADDTDASIDEARRLWQLVDRPNVMIKIPGTRAGWPAIEKCLYEGININITLLFSIEHYRAVAEAYLRAMELRIAANQAVNRVASVASIFVSRVDTEIDRRIVARGDAGSALIGRAGIANARLIYAEFQKLARIERWRSLAAHGTRPQRLLWASTGTKNPAYSDVLYVDSLIGRDTITTLPPKTLGLFEDHGQIMRTLPGDVAGAQRVMDELQTAGIDFSDVDTTLEREAIRKFVAAQTNLLNAIHAKRTAQPH
jgi:transaldolase